LWPAELFLFITMQLTEMFMPFFQNAPYEQIVAIYRTSNYEMTGMCW
jgi:hypothetical protein